VAVIGGGISGLAAAHHAQQLRPAADVVLLEAGSRLGGVLHTVQRDGFLLEEAADNFLTSPSDAIDLCRRLGLADELLAPDARRRQALVVHRGQLQPIPAGFLVMAPSRLWPLLSSPILSLRGKLRAGLEYFLPRKKSLDDESLQAFVCRRFGREMFERLVQPLIGGIYAADLQRLSLEATMPRFQQMEREHGSLIRAMLRNRRHQLQDIGAGGRYAQFAALRGGMSTLVDALAQRLPDDAVRLDSPVDGLFPTDHGRWLLAIGGARPRMLSVDAVIVATPAHHTAQLLERVDVELADELWQIEYSHCAVVSLGYRRSQIGRTLDGYGFVVPLVEQRLIFSCSFSSVKYAGRAAADSVLLRVFIGGACQSGLLQLPRAQLIELAEREIGDFLQITGEPVLRNIVRRAMPQYHVGHRQRVERIGERLSRYPTLALAGSSLDGVGLPSCIRSGEAAATRICNQLHSTSINRLRFACT
jgi:oxygen-dependent protoporphyrinogen oxidase